MLQGASYLQNQAGCGHLDEEDVEPVLRETVIRECSNGRLGLTVARL